MAINSKKNNLDESEVLAKLAALGMSNKKGLDIVMLDLRQLPTAPARFFVVCSGNVPSHVDAIADGVFETILKATGEKPVKMEGYNNAEWVLMDYFDVMVHVFQKDKRAFYRLEELWADGINIPYAPDEEIEAMTVGEKGIKRTKAASARTKAEKTHRLNLNMSAEELLAEDEDEKTLSSRPAARKNSRSATGTRRTPGASSGRARTAAAKDGRATGAKTAASRSRTDKGTGATDRKSRPASGGTAAKKSTAAKTAPKGSASKTASKGTASKSAAPKTTKSKKI